jgi:hypothetical protein
MLYHHSHHGIGAKSAPFKIRQLKTSCRIFRLRSLAPPFQLRPAALGSQFIGFVFALFATSRVYDRALKICDDLKFKP